MKLSSVQNNKIIIKLLKIQPFRFALKSIRNVFFPNKFNGALEKTINIEVSSICNAKCIFCPYRLSYRSKKLMPTNEFRKIAESAVKLGYENLDLTSPSGEFFIRNDALEIIRIAKQVGFKHVGTYTNGISLYKFEAKELLESGIDAILVSFPGFEDDNVYESVFGVKQIQSFKRSITALLETHRRLKSNVCVIFEPRTYLTLEQIKESEFYECFVSKFVSNKIRISEPLRVFDSWGGEIKKKDLIKGMKVDINPIKSIHPFKKVYLCCRLLYVGVLANGDVRMCNCRYDSTIETEEDSLFIDNLRNYGSLYDLILKNENRIKRIRSNFIHGNLPELCKKCPFYNPVEFIS